MSPREQMDLGVKRTFIGSDATVKLWLELIMRQANGFADEPFTNAV